jgi:hypothetical protein
MEGVGVETKMSIGLDSTIEIWVEFMISFPSSMGHILNDDI